MRWMKLSGIIGITLLILTIASFVFSLTSDTTQLLTKAQSPNAKFVLIIFFVVLLVVLFFFYYGFVKMGKFTKIKLLSVSSWLIISFIGALVASLVGLIFWFSSQTDLFGALSVLGSMIYYALLFAVAMGVAVILFYVGMIKARDQVKFTKIAGILGFVVIGSVILLIPFSAQLGNSVIFGILDLILSSALIVMMILSLFDASKKFENGERDSPQETVNQTATKPVVPQTPSNI